MDTAFEVSPDDPQGLADYRKVYETSGWSWPGDDVIRRDYLVADAC